MAIFSSVMAHSYDKMMQKAEVCYLHEWRSQLLTQTFGTVLEIGAGTGVNVDYYSVKANPIYLLEPDAAMQVKLKQKISKKNNTNTGLVY